VPPDSLFIDPFAEPTPLGSPAPPEAAAPQAVFAAPPAPEGLDDEPWTEPDIPFRPEPSGEQPSSRDRAGQRTNRPGRNGARGQARDRRVN
jgi:hypothetical protein